MIDMATDTEQKKQVIAETVKKVKFWKVVMLFFGIGILIGSCSLGMKLPVALFDLATGQ